MKTELLKVNHLKVQYRDHKISKDIISDISFSLKKNHCLGIIGESGSGKSITCKAILGLLEKNFDVKGDVVFNDIHLLKQDKRKIRHIRGKEISMILQNPMTSFDPLFTIQEQMTETFIENLDITKKEALGLSLKALEEMHILYPKDVLKKHPHQLSGGMLQRVMIGIALALKPSMIIADEPTTAVDAINVVKVMEEFMRIREKHHTSMIFVSHDLGVVSKIADHLLVMKEGEIVEAGETQHVLNRPSNEYTKYLIDTRNALVEKFYQVVG
ncbi:ABC-type dipeptide/oligopeptide/nickel transport system, ATpase component [Clostridium aceticum]|uniref:ABC-type dipeptide/oligopeptide/nickel transport system, ATpase component n=1 Tax=Clostridium aceticum TaxID=84022 RepID=A0A0D8ICS2_9CLOT|nr:ABC transporter ATP-binding protein [Clostridium aceticum]AKL95259.1 ABC-type dipeptide/oligopeptide/nickel transport system, ATpase component [Clostridium aceticum]KJF28110.1 peptide ABC transporter ATP-binding protein [Clostridium aceticum]